MSGGSFNHLCHRQIEELIERIGYTDALDMAEELSKLPDGETAARETLQLFEDLRIVAMRFEARVEKLRPLWRAVEWWKSCDTSKETALEALQEFNGDRTEPARNE